MAITDKFHKKRFLKPSQTSGSVQNHALSIFVRYCPIMEWVSSYFKIIIRADSCTSKGQIVISDIRKP